MDELPQKPKIKYRRNKTGCVSCRTIAKVRCSNTAHIPPDPTACQTIPPCARCCEKGIDCLYVSERRRERRPRRRRHSPDRCSGSPDGSSSQSSQEIAISTHQPPLDLSRSIVNLSPVIECANTQAFCSSQPLANAPLSSDNSAPFTLDAPELMALSAPLIPMPQEGLGRFDGFLQLSALEHGLCSSVENPDQPHPTPQLTPELGPSFSSNSFKDDPLDQPQLHHAAPSWSPLLSEPPSSFTPVASATATTAADPLHALISQFPTGEHYDYEIGRGPDPVQAFFSDEWERESLRYFAINGPSIFCVGGHTFSNEVFEAVIPLVMDNATVEEPAALSVARGLFGVVCFHRARLAPQSFLDAHNPDVERGRKEAACCARMLNEHDVLTHAPEHATTTYAAATLLVFCTWLGGEQGDTHRQSMQLVPRVLSVNQQFLPTRVDSTLRHFLHQVEVSAMATFQPCSPLSRTLTLLPADLRIACGLSAESLHLSRQVLDFFASVNSAEQRVDANEVAILNGSIINAKIDVTNADECNNLAMLSIIANRVMRKAPRGDPSNGSHVKTIIETALKHVRSSTSLMRVRPLIVACGELEEKNARDEARALLTLGSEKGFLEVKAAKGIIETLWSNVDSGTECEAWKNLDTSTLVL